MTRRMACSLTVDAVKARTKTVTRRHVDTWRTLRPGDRLTLIEKGMGLPKGAKQFVLADVEVTDVRVELLGYGLGPLELASEGFPELARLDFMVMWARSHGYTNAAQHGPLHLLRCRRIAWRYIRVLCPTCHNQFDGRMPGHHYGSGWDWVPCQTCQGAGLVDA